MKRIMSLVALCILGAQAAAQNVGDDTALLLVNGKFITLDGQGTIAESVLIHRGRIAAVNETSGDLASGAQVIDLGGRTVIPGLFDSHMHFIRATLRPGHDMRTCLLYTSDAADD